MRVPRCEDADFVDIVLRPERAHIVSDNFDWLFESDYEPQWPETFLTSHSP